MLGRKMPTYAEVQFKSSTAYHPIPNEWQPSGLALAGRRAIRGLAGSSGTWASFPEASPTAAPNCTRC